MFCRGSRQRRAWGNSHCQPHSLAVGRQHGAPVLVSLAAAHRDAVLLQVHILDPQPQRLHEPQATAIQQLGRQGLRSIEMTQNGPHFPHRVPYLQLLPVSLDQPWRAGLAEHRQGGSLLTQGSPPQSSTPPTHYTPRPTLTALQPSLQVTVQG